MHRKGGRRKWAWFVSSLKYLYYKYATVGN